MTPWGDERGGGSLAVAVVLFGAGIVWFGRDTGDGQGRRDEPGAPFPEGQLLVPGPIDGHRLERVERTDASRQLGEPLDGRGPIVVTEVDGGVVALTTISADVVRQREGDEQYAFQERVVGGVRVIGYLDDDLVPGVWMLLDKPALSWFETSDTIVTATSIGLREDQLAEVVEQVELTSAGEIAAPGEVIGTIPTTWKFPMPGVTAQYDDDGYEQSISVIGASPEVQAAYRALAPADLITGGPVVSCCPGHIESPPRDERIDGRDVHIATIDFWKRIVVVEGDPGAVIVADFHLDEDALLAIVESLSPTPPEEFQPLTPQ